MVTITNDINLLKCCRTCLNDGSLKMYDIFGEIYDTTDIGQLLMSCTDIEVNINDNFSKKLCGSCYNCLVSFHDFKKLAHKIDAGFRQQFDKLIIKSPEDNIPFTVKKESGINSYSFDDLDSESLIIKLESRNNNMGLKDIDILQNVEGLDKIHIENGKISSTSERSNKEKGEINKPKKKLKTYTCINCAEKFKHRLQLIEHVATHNNTSQVKPQDAPDLNFECDTCSARFRSLNSLSAHKRKHVAKDRILACSVCSKVFKKTSHLKRHELCHQVNHYYRCSMCSKRFLTEGALLDHVNKHNRIKSHTCPICSKGFCHLVSLTTHIKLHNSDKSHLCPTCGKKFGSSTNLKQHLNRHLGLKTFACSMCPRKFVTKGELKNHEISHTGKRSHTCEQCGGTFTRRSSLKNHMHSHLGIKPYQCDACKMKFTSKGHLRRHARTHTGERPFACERCGRAFLQSNDLVKHRRAHLGDLLYQCADCSQRFRLKSELRRHISDHFISSKMAAAAGALPLP